MFERELLKNLEQWSESKDRKPLVLRGARQVGKSTLVDEFAKKYQIYLKLNLEKHADALLFEDYTEINTLINAIYVANRQEKLPVSTILFIDEIQNSPKAVAMLRYFYEEANWLHVVAAGSLLESLMDKHISFPVGRVEFMAVHPCSFTEFLNGIGEGFDQRLVENIQAEAVHSRIMQNFRNFTVVGGMPEVVKKYAERRDILACDNIYDGLLTAYTEDVEKYARTQTLTQVIRFLIAEGWRYAGTPITFESFGSSNYRSREVGEAFRMLEKTMLLELVYPTTSTVLPILTSRNRKPKLIWLDTGLVNFVAGIRNEVFSVPDIADVWRGSIAEHIVAQELVANKTKVLLRRQYWVRQKIDASAEVDFVIPYKGMLIPIEVKSGHNAKLRSLHQFMDRTPHDIAVRIWSNPFSIDEAATTNGKKFRLLNVPFYYVCVLEKVLDKYV
jgi:predicted AAA+ superfamily ATPase